MLLALVSLAAADPIEAWTQDDWGREGEFVEQNDDWSNGYDEDPWYATESGVLIPLTDDNVEDDPNALFNWVVRTGDEVEQGLVEAVLFNADDDAIGIVSNHDGKDEFYLLLHSADSVPEGLDGSDDGRVYLIRAEGSDFQVLDSSAAELNGDRPFSLAISVDNGTIEGLFNGESVVQADDEDPLGPGFAGFWSYDSGYGGWGSDYCGALEIGVYWQDEDGDGVGDDVDNCEFVENPDQEDENDDGVGDACTEDEGDSGDPNDTGSGEDGLQISGSACGGCGGGTAGGGLLVLALGALFTRRRSR